MEQVKQSTHVTARQDRAASPLRESQAKAPAPWPLADLAASSPLQRARAAKALNRGIGNARLGRLMAAPLQRQEKLEEEEPLQRQKDLEEDELQMRAGPGTLQRQGAAAPAANRTDLPDPLKAGLEQLSGLDLSEVRVHRNSAKPAQLNALAYTQGRDIELGPGQERHLPHEGWHAVQQMQGRVAPTAQAKGVAINDDTALEREADVMGEKAAQMKRADWAAMGWPRQRPLLSSRTGQPKVISDVPGTLTGERDNMRVGSPGSTSDFGVAMAPATEVAQCYGGGLDTDLQELLERVLKSPDFKDLKKQERYGPVWQLIYDQATKRQPEYLDKKEEEQGDGTPWNVANETSKESFDYGFSYKQKGGFVWWDKIETQKRGLREKRRISLDIIPKEETFVAVAKILMRLGQGKDGIPIDVFKIPDTWRKANFRYDNFVVYYFADGDGDIAARIASEVSEYLRPGIPAFTEPIEAVPYGASSAKGWDSHGDAVATDMLVALQKVNKSASKIKGMDPRDVYMQLAALMNIDI